MGHPRQQNTGSYPPSYSSAPSWGPQINSSLESLLESESEVSQSCLTLCNHMDCSLRCSSVHGIFQARVLEWVAISFSRGYFGPRDWTQVSHIAGRSFTIWATREVPVFAFKLFLNFWLRLAACRILAFNQRSNLCPLHWEHGVLTTGSPHYKHHLIKIQLIPATLIL